MRRLWVLNLDAEVELSGRTASRAAAERTRDWAAEVAKTLPPGDAWVETFEGGAEGWQGEAWCPTPNALQQLSDAGARLPTAPPIEVLRRVNDRAFAYRIERLPGAWQASTDDGVSVPDGERVWLRRGLAFAGRGVRRATGPLGPSDLQFMNACLRQGNLFVEPQVEVLLDVALHGHTDGRLGQLTVATLDRGQWRGSRLAEPGELSDGERSQMRESLSRAAEALDHAGYSGPFGIDGFRWRDAEEAVHFHPLSDLNARYSMGWATGMGGW